jgi:hypothetical protein
MKVRVLTFVAGVAVLPSLAAAQVAPCVDATLEKYMALGPTGCMLNGTHFADFGFVPTVPVPYPRLVQVTPQPAIGFAASLKFTAPWRALPGQEVRSAIRYTVRLQPWAPTGVLQLHLGPDLISGANGTVRVDEVAVPVTYLSVLHLRQDGVDRRIPDAERLFTPPTALRSVDDRITVLGGDKGAALAYFAATFNVQ